jgi:hypothetical protein
MGKIGIRSKYDARKTKRELISKARRCKIYGIWVKRILVWTIPSNTGGAGNLPWVKIAIGEFGGPCQGEMGQGS